MFPEQVRKRFIGELLPPQRIDKRKVLVVDPHDLIRRSTPLSGDADREHAAGRRAGHGACSRNVTQRGFGGFPPLLASPFRMFSLVSVHYIEIMLHIF